MSFADFESDPAARKPQAGSSQGDYVDMYKAQSRRIQEILKGSKELRELMKKKEDESVRKKMTAQLLAMQKLCGESNQTLKAMKAYVDKSPDCRQGFVTIQKQLFEAIGGFQEISREHQARQQRLMAEDQRRLHDLKELQDDASDDATENDSLLREDRDRQQKRLQVSSEVAHNEAIIRERGQDLQDLQSKLVDVNEIFKDLHSMAIAQGEPLDSIENAVVTAHEKAVGGVNELKTASRHQKRGRKLMCILVALLVCVVVTIIIVLVVFLKLIKLP